MTEMLVDSVELQLNHHTLGQDFSVEIGERGSQGAGAENAFVSGESKLYILIISPYQFTSSMDSVCQPRKKPTSKNSVFGRNNERYPASVTGITQSF